MVSRPLSVSRATTNAESDRELALREADAPFERENLHRPADSANAAERDEIATKCLYFKLRYDPARAHPAGRDGHFL